MAHTTEKTWSVGETLTAANFNAQIRDNLRVVAHRIPKTADQTVTSSTALVDDTHLQFAIGANEGWEFSLYLLVTGPGFFKNAFNAPASAAGWWWLAGSGNAGGTVQTATFVDGEANSNSTNPEGLSVYGYVLNGATPGTFKLRWAQASSSGTATTIKKGSWLERRLVT